jgi:hypothetical protein
VSDVYRRICELVVAGDREYSAHAVNKMVQSGIVISPLVDTLGTRWVMRLSWRSTPTIMLDRVF